MIVAVITLAVVVALLLVDRHKSQSQFVDAVNSAATARLDLERAYAVERSELLHRVQHPEIVIAPRQEARAAPVPDLDFAEAEKDDFDLVGTISLSPGDEDLAAA